MAKVGGTYPTIIQGVSEKQPHHRLPGQTGEQINVLSDPVHGLVRRRGTRYAGRIAATLDSASRAELANMDVFDFVMNGKEYSLLHRRFASTLPKALFAFLYCKTDEEFIPITYENSSWVDTLVSGGVSSLAAIGQYVYISGNDNVPTAVQENKWDTPENQSWTAAWFRVGKYDTEYKVSLIREDGTKITKVYKTMAATYPEVLNTSDIPFFETDGTTPRPDYQKDVNDRIDEYNSLVNEWVIDAADNITPQNIAEQFAEQLSIDGIGATSFENGGLLIEDDEFVDIEVYDGADNTTVYTVGKEITDPTRVTKYHFHGKIVRVRPSGAGADEAYYLEARLDSGATSGHGAVSWFEVEGVSAQITNMVSQMIVYDGQAYLASTGAGLEALAPLSGEHPDYKPRVAGDGITSPLPWFIGKRITMLAVFQDRLVLGSDNYVNTSRSGDYLNFFRGSVLGIPDSDPVEMFAHGSEGDVLKSSTLYNGNLIIFGVRQQYGVSGEQLLTPRSPLIRPISANRDAVDALPITSGNFIFYAQHGDSGTGLHQLRVGALNGQVTVSDSLSDDLDSWLNGRPVQIVAITDPNLLLFRTSGHASDIYTYRYLDDPNNGQRYIGAWAKFQYNPALGTIIGASSFRKSALVFTARAGYVVCDFASFSADPDLHGNMDSRVPFADRADIDVVEDEAVAVLGASNEGYLLGTPMEKYEEFLAQMPDAEADLEFGVVSEAMVIPTNPFPRDQNGQAVLDGRMALNRVTADVNRTGGFVADVSTTSGVIRTTDFEGRILGSTTNVLGQQPLYTGQLSISVGREVRDCFYTIRSKDWLPMRVTGLSWAGQTFNNVRRVS